MKSVLIDKAKGDIHTRINNAKYKGGAFLYADLYKWFTETSGLGLAEQVVKLISPDRIKKEEDLAETLETWGTRVIVVHDSDQTISWRVHTKWRQLKRC